MKDTAKNNCLNLYRDEANLTTVHLIKKACEHLLVKNKKISPQSTHDVMVELANDIERKHLIKYSTLRRKNHKWRAIIDEYEAYRLKNPVNKEHVDLDVKFSEQRLAQQNYMLREKVLDLSDEVATLKASLNKTDNKTTQNTSSHLQSMQMIPLDETTDDYRAILAGVVSQLLNHTHLVEIDINGNLKAFGKDGKVMLLHSETLNKLSLY